MMLVTRECAHHPYTPAKIAILSGLSDRSTCALSDIQRDFLARIDAPESWKVDRNFPYIDAPQPRRDPHLLVASFRNAMQFFGASQRTYVAHAKRHWRALRDSTGALFVITLSCGLEILRNVIDANDDVRVLALGPVARALPNVPCTLLRGTHDPLARVFFKHATVLPKLGHLDYFRSDVVLRITNEWICSNTSKSSAAASISRNAS
jgi:hypothetical protein